MAYETVGGDLVTQDQAIKHLRLTVDATQDADTLADLTEKITAASVAIRIYLDTGGNDPTWDPTTAPADVRGAALLALGALWRDRGDEPGASPSISSATWLTIRDLLGRRRLPVTS